MNKHLEQADKIINQVRKIDDYFDNKTHYSYLIVCEENLGIGHSWKFDLTFSYKGKWDKMKLFKTMVEDSFKEFKYYRNSYGCRFNFSYYSSQTEDIPNDVDVIELNARFPING